MQADDYAYLVFETTDGAKASVSVEGLTLTISGTTLTVGTQSFTLSNLSKMYFSASDETTGIKPLTISPEGERSEAFPREGLDGVIYDLQGHKVTKEQMRKGVYVVRTNGKTYKVTAIAANAFKNNKKLKKVTIGENVKTIGKNAFYGCKKLKTVTIKTSQLTKKTVGKNAFAKINSKTKVKVPKSKLKAYKKLLKSKGINGKKQKISF